MSEELNVGTCVSDCVNDEDKEMVLDCVGDKEKLALRDCVGVCVRVEDVDSVDENDGEDDPLELLLMV